MSQFIIKGGNQLKGKVKLAGAKNAASKFLIASLLTDDKCTFINFPNIGETKITSELCSQVGSSIGLSNSVLEISTPEIKNSTVTTLSRRNRIPILALGPLLARVGKAEVPALGGDKIGHRPINLHLRALEALGAKIEVGDESFKAETKGLRGADIELPFPSVGATENIILAATTASGTTNIMGAAVEPEIIDLIKLLQKMGAIIELGADRRITIEGVDHLSGVTHEVLPDRNEAVSFASLALATNGDIFVQGARQDDLITFLNTIRKMGGDYKVESDGIRFWKAEELSAINITTDTHPGFMTDWQQPLGVVMTQSRGLSSIHEVIYEDRFGYAEDLNLMGAHIRVTTECPDSYKCRFFGKGFHHVAEIEGPTPLKGADIQVRDLRAGMAHVIAALVADGQSVISGIDEIDRGYENIDARLRSLGADITRKP